MDKEAMQRILDSLREGSKKLDEIAGLPTSTNFETLSKLQLLDAAYACLFSTMNVIIQLLTTIEDKQSWNDVVETLAKLQEEAKESSTRACLDTFLKFSRVIAQG